MKTIAIETETRPLGEWLPREDSDEAIYLTREGRPRYVVVPLDEGDEEVLAVQQNAKLMAHIAQCVERARQGPKKSLAQIKSELGLDSDVKAPGPAATCADAPDSDGT
jgi:hypothetical protein